MALLTAKHPSVSHLVQHPRARSGNSVALAQCGSAWLCPLCDFIYTDLAWAPRPAASMPGWRREGTCSRPQLLSGRAGIRTQARGRRHSSAHCTLGVQLPEACATSSVALLGGAGVKSPTGAAGPEQDDVMSTSSPTMRSCQSRLFMSPRWSHGA